MPIIDANIILRYLLGDHPEFSPRARDIILSGAQTTPEVLAEVVYVLKGVYQAERADIADTVGAFLQEVSIAHKAAIAYACKLYGATNLDYVDCVLAGYHFIDGADIATFDHKLKRTLLQSPMPDE